MLNLNSYILLLAIVAFMYIGYIIGRKIEDASWRMHKLEPIVKSRIKTSRSVIGGQFSEQLAPFLPNFPYKPSEVRFMGKPIDFIVFKGMDDKNITEVIFVEVKSGIAKNLNKNERILRDIIKARKVRWEQYNVNEEITK